MAVQIQTARPTPLEHLQRLKPLKLLSQIVIHFLHIIILLQFIH
jgi:hypothetical protein